MNNKQSHGLACKIAKGFVLNIVVSVVIVASLHLFFYLIG